MFVGVRPLPRETVATPGSHCQHRVGPVTAITFYALLAYDTANSYTGHDVVVCARATADPPPAKAVPCARRHTLMPGHRMEGAKGTP